MCSLRENKNCCIICIYICTAVQCLILLRILCTSRKIPKRHHSKNSENEEATLTVLLLLYVCILRKEVRLYILCGNEPTGDKQERDAKKGEKQLRVCVLPSL